MEQFDVRDLLMFRSSVSHRLIGSHMLIQFDWLINVCHTVHEEVYDSLERGEKPCSYLDQV
jgi:hypothetical protein